MHPLLNVAIIAARQAGDIILRNIALLDRIQVNTKHNNELFSEVDIKAEQIIIKTIRKAYPNHAILAEESGMHNSDTDYLWIIDPLDGTLNYLHSYPNFVVSIACKFKNRIEHAVIYDPLRNECFTASRGGGAQINEKRLRVSKQIQLNSSLLAIDISTKIIENKYLSIFKSLVEQSCGIRNTGASVLDLAYVASGRLDGFWGLGLRHWDIAAGSLLIKEAGGLISDMFGGENYFYQGDVIAGNPKIFKILLQNMYIKKSNNTMY